MSKKEKKDWREELKEVMQSQPARVPDSNREQIDVAREELEQFIVSTVVPAFQDLEKELANYGRTVEIDPRKYQASIQVFKDGKEEFSYGIRGHVYHTMSFAFPEFGGKDEPRITRAEVVPKRGGKREYDLDEFTRDGIIHDFLEEYSNWAE